MAPILKASELGSHSQVYASLIEVNVLLKFCFTWSKYKKCVHHIYNSEHLQKSDEICKTGESVNGEKDQNNI